MEDKKQVTVRIDRRKLIALKKLLLDWEISFQTWIDRKVDEELSARLGAVMAGQKQEAHE